MAFEQKILNDVWDAAAHALRSTAGVAANPQTTLSFNAAGDLIKVEELENGSFWYYWNWRLRHKCFLLS